MKKKCQSCDSCGMPLEKPEDHALGDIQKKICKYCTDTKGNLKPYEEVLSGMANYLVHSQGIDMNAAKTIAKDVLSKLPAWSKHA